MGSLFMSDLKLLLSWTFAWNPRTDLPLARQAAQMPLRAGFAFASMGLSQSAGRTTTSDVRAIGIAIDAPDRAFARKPTCGHIERLTNHRPHSDPPC
jgi:hypothetical protein